MNRKCKTRLLIADNQRLVADACKQMLEPEFDVVGIVSDGRALVQMALRLKPDLVFLELLCLSLMDSLLPHRSNSICRRSSSSFLPRAQMCAWPPRPFGWEPPPTYSSKRAVRSSSLRFDESCAENRICPP